MKKILVRFLKYVRAFLFALYAAIISIPIVRLLFVNRTVAGRTIPCLKGFDTAELAEKICDTCRAGNGGNTTTKAHELIELFSHSQNIEVDIEPSTAKPVKLRICRVRHHGKVEIAEKYVKCLVVEIRLRCPGEPEIVDSQTLDYFDGAEVRGYRKVFEKGTRISFQISLPFGSF